MLDYYLKLRPKIRWIAQYEARTLGGVRGAPWAHGPMAHSRLLDCMLCCFQLSKVSSLLLIS